jgi:hypothetical protein
MYTIYAVEHNPTLLCVFVLSNVNLCLPITLCVLILTLIKTVKVQHALWMEVDNFATGGQ